MKLYDNFWIYKNRTSGAIASNILSADGSFTVSTDSCDLDTTRKLHIINRIAKKHTYEETKRNWIEYYREQWGIVNKTTSEEATVKAVDDPSPTNNVDKTKLVERIMNFFSEFRFSTNFRFINTLAYATQMDIDREYVKNYFNLTDNENKDAIADKLKSLEWMQIRRDLAKINVNNKINNRFKLYYGAQGTGKTTDAIKESSSCMVCHSAMLPSDLMEDFKFIDGKATFEPSALYRAMEKGLVITLDEINLLPFESLRFLQSILDGKTEFEYKGKTVHIADGFKIIGTMNLVVNGVVYALPEPLVDRAEELKEFTLTAENLVGALN